MTFAVILIILFSAALLAVIIWLIIKSMTLKTVSGREGMIGESGVLISPVLSGKAQVRVHGEIWQATSTEALQEGDKVIVTGIDRLILEVKKK